MTTLISCKSCGANVVPRLWSYGGGLLSYSTTQHICSICGAVMYETGGEMKGKGKFLLWLIFIIAVGVSLPKSFQENFISLGLILLFGYFLLVRPIIIFIQGFLDGYRRK